LPGPDEVSFLQELLHKVAREKDPRKLADLLGRIESAAREEQAALRRKLETNIEKYRSVERRNWKRLIENSGSFHAISNENAAAPKRDRGAEQALRYLKLADAALRDRPAAPRKRKKTSA
jgi:hypothetical protein